MKVRTSEEQAKIKEAEKQRKAAEFKKGIKLVFQKVMVCNHCFVCYFSIFIINNTHGKCVNYVLYVEAKSRMGWPIASNDRETISQASRCLYFMEYKKRNFLE